MQRIIRFLFLLILAVCTTCMTGITDEGKQVLAQSGFTLQVDGIPISAAELQEQLAAQNITATEDNCAVAISLITTLYYNYRQTTSQPPLQDALRGNDNLVGSVVAALPENFLRLLTQEESLHNIATSVFGYRGTVNELVAAYYQMAEGTPVVLSLSGKNTAGETISLSLIAYTIILTANEETGENSFRFNVYDPKRPTHPRELWLTITLDSQGELAHIDTTELQIDCTAECILALSASTLQTAYTNLSPALVEAFQKLPKAEQTIEESIVMTTYTASNPDPTKPQYEIKLTWNTTDDLDLSVQDSVSTEKISYSSKTRSWGKLSLDDTNGYGPEIITINNTAGLSTYIASVKCYSHRAEGNTTATVRVYWFGRLIAEKTGTFSAKDQTWTAARIYHNVMIETHRPSEMDFDTLYFYEIRLAWDNSSDMDLHALAPDGSECYYRNKHPSWGSLDRDDTDGYGPEIISIKNSAAAGNYKIKVKCYTHKGGKVTGNLLIYWYGIVVDERSHDFSSSGEEWHPAYTIRHYPGTVTHEYEPIQ